MRIIFNYLVVIIMTSILCGSFGSILLVLIADPSLILRPSMLWQNGFDFASAGIAIIAIVTLTYGVLVHTLLKWRGRLSYGLFSLSGALAGAMVLIYMGFPIAIFTVVYSVFVGFTTFSFFYFLFTKVEKER